MLRSKNLRIWYNFIVVGTSWTPWGSWFKRGSRVFGTYGPRWTGWTSWGTRIGRCSRKKWTRRDSRARWDSRNPGCIGKIWTRRSGWHERRIRVSGTRWPPRWTGSIRTAGSRRKRRWKWKSRYVILKSWLFKTSDDKDFISQWYSISSVQTNRALESWFLRPFSGWRYCFHGHFWKIRDNIIQGKSHSDQTFWYLWSINNVAKPLE